MENYILVGVYRYDNRRRRCVSEMVLSEMNVSEERYEHCFLDSLQFLSIIRQLLAVFM